MSANVVIQFRRGTAAEWSAANPTLASGEIGYETDTYKLKAGDGVTVWNSLPYVSTMQAGILNDISDVVITSAANGDFLRWDGSKWINDAVNLSTDTIGEYVAILDAGTNVTITNNSGEGATPTITVDGALTDITSIATPNYIYFNTSVSESPDTAGQIGWNSDDGTLDLGLDTGGILKLGQEMVYHVHNSTASTIYAGQSVGYAGTHGSSGKILIEPFVADATNPSKKFLGVVTSDIEADQVGYVAFFGTVRGVKTNYSGWSAGDILYADPSSSSSTLGLTNVQPSAPNNIIAVAVIQSVGNNGNIFVRPTFGSNLGDDEAVTLTSPQNKDSLFYNSSTGVWENSPINLGDDTVGSYVSILEAGTGVTIINNSGESATPNIAIGQDVSTTADVTFGTATINGLTTVGGSIIPDTDVSYDLGSATYSFRDIYLSGTTINLGGGSISFDGTKFSLEIANPPWTQLGADIDGEAIDDSSGSTVSLSADGTIVAIAAKGNDGNGSSAGHVRVYEWNGSAWVQKGADIDGEATNDNSADSVSLSADGTIVAIGAPGNDGNGSAAGHVRVYEWNGTSWVQRGADIDGEAAGDQSGWSVSLSSDGSIVAIGAHRNDGNGTNAGHVRVFEWSGSAWVQKGADIDGEAAFDGSGYSVSLSADGSIVAIGSKDNDGNGSNAGHVRVFEWSGSAWVQKGADIDGEAAGDQSGSSVSLSGDGSIVAIAAKWNTNDVGTYAGHVRVFEWNSGTSSWDQKGTDIDGEAASDYSGDSVSLSSDGSIVAIGTTYNDGNGSNAGHVRVFEWNGSAWVQKGTDIDGEAANDFSGRSVSLSSDGTIVAIGATANDGNGTDAGHVRVYGIVSSASGSLTGDLTGNADTATSLETARTIQISGDVAGSASFDGTADINISATIQADSVTLGADTTGDYVSSLVAGTGISISDNSGESATPSIAVNTSEIATRSYVDSIATGINWHKAVNYASASALPNSPSYDNGSSGVGATLQGTTNGRLSIDGANASDGDRILIKDQSDASQNGIYSVTSQGSAVSTWTITRSQDADGTPETIDTGDAVYVTSGSTNLNQGFVVTSSGTGTNDVHIIGTDDISYTQFTGPAGITAGDGLTKSANTINVQSASSNRIVVNSNDIDLAEVTVVDSDSGTASGFVSSISVDSYGRVTQINTSVLDSINSIDDVSATPSDRHSLMYDGHSSHWISRKLDIGLDTTGYYVKSISGGTGVTIEGGEAESATPTISIGQSVETSDDVTFASVTADLTGDVYSQDTTPVKLLDSFGKSFYGSLNGNVTGDVTGNLTGNVDGDLTGDVYSQDATPVKLVDSANSIFNGEVIGNVNGDVTGNLTGDVTGNVTGLVTGDVTGNVTGNLTGNVTGDLTGDVTGNVTGDLTGDVTGNVTGNLTGDVTGNVTGSVVGDIVGSLYSQDATPVIIVNSLNKEITGNLIGDVTGNVTGDVTGDVGGNLTGDVTGNVTGDLTGSVTGNVTGDLTGDVTGNLTGNVTGDVTGDVTGNLTGDVIGNVTGNLTGDVTGNVTGDVTGSLTGNVTGDVTGDLTGNVTGDLTGDVYSQDATPVKIVDSTNSTFKGDLTGNVTGDLTGDVTGNLIGNADTASAWSSSRQIALTGDVTGDVLIDGSANVSISTTISSNSVALGADTTGSYVSILEAGTGITLANNSGESATPNISIGQDVGTTADVTFNTVTADLTGDVTGNSDTASAWATARTISLSGDLSGSVSINGSADVTLTATVIADSVQLGTDTTGDYIESITAGTGVTVTSGTGEGAATTVAIGQSVETSATPNFNGATLGNMQFGITSANEIDTTSDGLTLDSSSGETTIDDNLTVTGTLDVTGQAVFSSTIQAGGDIDANSNKIINLSAPTATSDAANKQYVDEIAQGVIAKPSVLAATTENLTSNYSNGTDGVGATLTSTSNGALPSIDGVSGWSQYDGILVKDQTNKAENGRYYVSTVGDESNPWVLTRCGYCDTADEIPGAYIFVQSGTINEGTGWVLVVDDPATYVVGTDDVDVFQFAGAGTYTAGTGLTLSGTQFSVNASQTQITEVGTLASGAWEASVIDSTYGGTGVNNGGRTITVNTGNLTIEAATPNSSVTFPASGTMATIAGTETLTNKTLTSPIVNTPELTLSTTTSSTDGRISWDTTEDKIVVGNGTDEVEFSSSLIKFNQQATTSYTLVLSDKDKMVEMHHTSANTLTIPPESSVNFPIGTQIMVLQTNAGQTTIAAGAGVSVHATPGLKLRDQYAMATMIKRGSDTWIVTGDLSA